MKSIICILLLLGTMGHVPAQKLLDYYTLHEYDDRNDKTYLHSQYITQTQSKNAHDDIYHSVYHFLDTSGHPIELGISCYYPSGTLHAFYSTDVDFELEHRTYAKNDNESDYTVIIHIDSAESISRVDITSEFDTPNRVIHYVANEHLIDHYLNWIKKNLDTLAILPPLVPYDQRHLKKKLTTDFFSESNTVGDTSYYIHYKIDSIHTKPLIVDSTCINMNKHYKHTKNGEVSFYRQSNNDSLTGINTYEYDSLNAVMEENWIAIKHGDTIFNMHSHSEKQENGFQSTYTIAGNKIQPYIPQIDPLLPYGYTINLYESKQIISRKIVINRDLEWQLTGGWAEGLSIDGDSLYSTLSNDKSMYGGDWTQINKYHPTMGVQYNLMRDYILMDTRLLVPMTFNPGPVQRAYNKSKAAHKPTTFKPKTWREANSIHKRKDTKKVHSLSSKYVKVYKKKGHDQYDVYRFYLKKAD